MATTEKGVCETVPILLAASDTHLKPHIWTHKPDIKGDAFFSFHQIFDLAKKLNIPVALSGDVFDVNCPDSLSFYQALINIKDFHQKTQLPVYFIQGQHEKSNPPWLSSLPGTVYLHETLTDLPYGFSLSGLDYILPDKSKEEFKKIKIKDQKTILLTHQVWSEIMSIQGLNFCSFNDLPSLNTVITGDFHGHFIKKINTNKGTVQVVSPGSSYLNSIDEDNNKYVFTLMSDGSFVSHKIITRPVRKWEIRGHECVHYFSEEIKKYYNEDNEYINKTNMSYYGIDKPIFIIYYFENFFDLDSITSLVGDSVHWVFKPKKFIDKEQIFGSNLIEKWQISEKVNIDFFLKNMTQDDTRLYEACRRLLYAKDSKTELKSMIDEMLNNLS